MCPHPTRSLARLVAVIAAGSTLPACDPLPSSGATRETSVPNGDLIVAPDDGTTSILGAIAGAHDRVLVEMYMLTAPEALAALVAAQRAGVDVRVLLEPAPFGDATANHPAFATLAAAGIDVRWTTRTVGLSHAKMIIVDGQKLFVMTMNLTDAGLEWNREYAVVDQDPGDLAWAARIWNADAIGGDPGPAPAGVGLVVSPLDARLRLGACIDAARASLVVEMEELSDADLVGRLLTAAVARGVAVTVVGPADGRSPATSAAFGRLAAAGAMVRVLSAPVIHAKAMVIDGRRLYVGSINLTRASLDDNREIGLLEDDTGASARVAARISADAAAGFDL